MTGWSAGTLASRELNVQEWGAVIVQLGPVVSLGATMKRVSPRHRKSHTIRQGRQKHGGYGGCSHPPKTNIQKQYFDQYQLLKTLTFPKRAEMLRDSFLIGKILSMKEISKLYLHKCCTCPTDLEVLHL